MDADKEITAATAGDAGCLMNLIAYTPESGKQIVRENEIMSNLLTTSSVLMCPHGGTVMIVSSNARAKAGDFLVRASDTFTIAGCPFTLPSSTPHPCVRVQWVKSTLRCQAGGDFLLNQDGVGLCLAADQAPQGTVLIQSTQTRASGQ